MLRLVRHDKSPSRPRLSDATEEQVGQRSARSCKKSTRRVSRKNIHGRLTRTMASFYSYCGETNYWCRYSRSLTVLCINVESNGKQKDLLGRRNHLALDKRFTSVVKCIFTTTESAVMIPKIHIHVLSIFVIVQE